MGTGLVFVGAVSPGRILFLFFSFSFHLFYAYIYIFSFLCTPATPSHPL
jgi:hypothetical protein